MKFIPVLLIGLVIIWVGFHASLWVLNLRVIEAVFSILPDAIGRLVYVIGFIAFIGLVLMSTFGICDLLGIDYD
ncbi:MAG: hypothetical protein A3I26_00965 [Candidatus Yanofskybacteria bacterium RIFCSPLOWO2_02_FULL_43_10]|uniref:Uncharacterized protein n=1 Tax=Candidatus Yanofskybacteria bacterium RIFCSPLOWO2_12_FULL_43_11b TaxID=1802710 RepID=A0A1F8H6P6_9BACT|nr:MAG: hypothetical protein A2742_01250 [Candidatus Yanofskybacteria bacterium RIFCSPHIGHO2_01_FULL_43_32]OGN11965.1 MAG: hypothetical protein A3C69_02785 [Candidatus Yanofskybacteria bacterium RIFCSPHIGHO2_02_FULL_43_12]OGN17289.1 MAG: hypothetical protein A3E34_00730 [Candidatus Yanofskybacteria bacterium RIFCSPHIGHO2_12_FULL_43_11]OGN24750.1 MAG: hypothetical protein A2923_02940 [Candidatus Yanofskybacteria bacterium RIFCSPLOWO2_01_FULL_43_46]OGN30613.1 MAG: hypothetical protein A3I26_00965